MDVDNPKDPIDVASSKMEESAAASEDEFFEKEKNAEEYFKELEEKKSRATPEGQTNSNADGGSIFNQTGGRFLNRN